jgi:acyl carrier protein
MTDIAFQNLQQRITRLFAEDLHLEVPAIDADLIEAGILDSLVFIELLTRLEQVFSLRVAMEQLDVDRFRSISRIAEYVASHQSAA